MHAELNHAQSGGASFSRYSSTMTEPSIEPELWRLAGYEDIPIFPRSEGTCLDLVKVWCRAKRACTKVPSVGDSLAIPPTTPFFPTRAVPGEKTSVFRSQLVAHVRVDDAVLRPDSQALPAELLHKHW